MWVYIKSEADLWTVGFYSPDGTFHIDSDGTKEECADRCHWLNGGVKSSETFNVDEERWLTSKQ